MNGYADFAWTPAAVLEAMSRDDELWQHYLDTAVHFDHPDQSGTVVPDTQGAGQRLPFGSLHVVTAVQPDASPYNAESRARMAILDAELRASGERFIRAVGSALDGSHAEESRAVFGLTDEKARALGRRFGQVAIFGWSGPRWSLLACVGDRYCHRGWRWESVAADRQARRSGEVLNGRSETSE